MEAQKDIETNETPAAFPPDIDLSKLYPFDSDEVRANVEMPGGVRVVHRLTKPTLKDHLEREAAIKRIQEINASSEITGKTDESKANEGFYDKLILGATITYNDDTGEPQKMELNATECIEGNSQFNGFTLEQKTKAIASLYRMSVEVETDKGNPLAVLFEPKGTSLRVRQLLGNPDKPSYTIVYTIKAPSKSQRNAYNVSSVQTKRKNERNKTRLETTFNLEKGVTLFNTLFESVEGGMVDDQPFTSAARAEFLKEIDPVFKNSVIDNAVDYFNNSGQD